MNLSFVEEKMGAFRRIGPMRNGDGSVLDLTGGSWSLGAKTAEAM